MHHLVVPLHSFANGTPVARLCFPVEARLTSTSPCATTTSRACNLPTLHSLAERGRGSRRHVRGGRGLLGALRVRAARPTVYSVSSSSGHQLRHEVVDAGGSLRVSLQELTRLPGELGDLLLKQRGQLRGRRPRAGAAPLALPLRPRLRGARCVRASSLLPCHAEKQGQPCGQGLEKGRL